MQINQNDFHSLLYIIKRQQLKKSPTSNSTVVTETVAFAMLCVAAYKVPPIRGQELYERDGRPALPVPNCPYGLCGRKATLNEQTNDPANLMSPLCSEECLICA